MYGGAFDPLTVAHEAVIRDLFLHSVMEQVKHIDSPITAILILVSDNDEKKYTAPVEDRIRMAELAVDSLLGLPVYSHLRDYVEVVRQPHRMYRTLTEDLQLPKEKVSICIGADEWRQLYNNHNWERCDELLKEFSFRVYGRKVPGYLSPDLGMEGRCAATINCAGKLVVVADPARRQIPLDEIRRGTANAVIPPVSSTAVRRAMRFNPMYDGTDIPNYVRDYVAASGIYDQTEPYAYERSEGDAMAHYDPDKYPKCSVTATTVIYFQGKVLLVRRKYGPFKGYWCLPGGFANPHEDIEQVAMREVEEETGLDGFPGQVKHIGVYTPDDPRNRVREDHWSYDVGLAVGLDHVQEPKAGDDAREAEWVPLEEAMKFRLAFHHNRILKDFNERYPNGLTGLYGVRVIPL